MVALVAVPVVLVAAMPGDFKWNLALRRLAILVSIPLVIGFGLSAKNFYNVGVFSTSSLGGQNMMQFTSIQNGGGLEQVYADAEKNNFPDWWLWCFRHSLELRYEINGPLYGLCFRTTSDVFEFDFETAQEQLA
jgi:hypothetical protein